MLFGGRRPTVNHWFRERPTLTNLCLELIQLGGSIAQMLLAQRDLLEFKVREQEACADLEIARARLRETLGEPLPELEPRGEQDVR